MHTFIQQLLKYYNGLYIICGVLALLNIFPTIYLLIGCLLLGGLELVLRKKMNGYLEKGDVPIFRWLSEGAVLGIIVVLVVFAVKAIFH